MQRLFTKFPLAPRRLSMKKLLWRISICRYCNNPYFWFPLAWNPIPFKLSFRHCEIFLFTKIFLFIGKKLESFPPLQNFTTQSTRSIPQIKIDFKNLQSDLARRSRRIVLQSCSGQNHTPCLPKWIRLTLYWLNWLRSLKALTTNTRNFSLCSFFLCWDFVIWDNGLSST